MIILDRPQLICVSNWVNLSTPSSVVVNDRYQNYARYV